MAKLNTYLDQIRAAAADAGVDLAAACREEGIAATTLMRWEKGLIAPREATALALMRRIRAMAESRNEAAA